MLNSGASLNVLFFKPLDDFSSKDFIREVSMFNPIFKGIFYYEQWSALFSLSKYPTYNLCLKLKEPKDNFALFHYYSR
jgi:hypothetical protein